MDRTGLASDCAGFGVTGRAASRPAISSPAPSVVLGRVVCPCRLSPTQVISGISGIWGGVRRCAARREDRRVERADFEIDDFPQGTIAVARAAADVPGTRIVGGDSIAAIKTAGTADRVTHISTAGGASLELLGGPHAARRAGGVR